MQFIIPLIFVLGACNSGVEETTQSSTTATTTSTTTPASGTTTGTTTTTTTTTTATTTAPCDVTVVATNPADGDMDVPVNSPLILVFNDQVFDGEWSMDVDGVDGTATLAVGGMSATFIAVDNYDASSSVTANWSVCQTSGTFSFMTGGPTKGDELPGNTYLVDYNDVEWVEPSTLVDVFGDEIDLEHILIMVTDYNDATDELGVVGALGEDVGAGIEQAACYTPMLFSDVDFADNPSFFAGPSTLSVDLGGVTATLEDLFIEATFSTDAEKLQNVAITGYIDTRALDGFMDIADISFMLEFVLKIPIVPCSDGATECVYAHLAVPEAGLFGQDLIDPAYDPETDPICND
jgi:hypothetical protein